MTRTSIRRLAIGVSTAALALGMTGITAVAHAADPEEPTPDFTAQYDATGSARITKGNFTVPLGPTKLTAAIKGNADNPDQLDFLANLPLQPKTVAFKAFGYLPVQAKVYFTQVGRVTGSLSLTADTTSVNAFAQYVVTLRDVIVGYSKANVGDNCQTRYPINVNVSGDENFNLGGGNLVGDFDLGKFNNCKTSTELVNLIVPSPRNSIKLKLTNLNIVDDEPALRTTINRFKAAK